MNVKGIIYNQTFHVSNAILTDWKQWANTIYIPLVLETGSFQSATLLKLLHQDESEGITFAIQFHCNSYEAYGVFHREHNQQLAHTIATAWGQQCLYFSTVLEIVN